MRQTIAIIGGGIAGLTAGYLLQQKYDVTLFEKTGRIGGNAYTLDLPDGQSVDIAAAVYGGHSYHNLFKLFQRLNVETVRAARLGVSFYNIEDHRGIFLIPSIKGLLAQHLAVLKPRHLRSLLRLVTSIRKAELLRKRGELDGLTVEQALHKLPELRGDAKLVFLSFLCLISSMHCEQVLDAPAAFFVDTITTYNDLIPPRALMSVHLTKQRTKHYVEALSSGFTDRIVLSSKIRIVRRDKQVTLLMHDGSKSTFDKIVFACNADQALNLLEDPTSEEKQLLGAWTYTEGTIVVHGDHAHFPKKELMEGFIFLYRHAGRYIETSVSGALWALPGVSKKCDLISTQHPNFPIRKEHIVFEKVFRTPRFDFHSCSTRERLPSLNGIRGTYYCGSHFGFGLHEDAVSSAIHVARALGVSF